VPQIVTAVTVKTAMPLISGDAVIFDRECGPRSGAQRPRRGGFAGNAGNFLSDFPPPAGVLGLQVGDRPFSAAQAVFSPGLAGDWQKFQIREAYLNFSRIRPTARTQCRPGSDPKRARRDPRSDVDELRGRAGSWNSTLKRAICDL
jgi:hypothetical protein